MELIKIGDVNGDILLEKSERVEFPLFEEDKIKIAELAEYMLTVNKKSQGISAIQVGWAKRIAIVRTGGNPFLIINPAVMSKFGVQISTESCLSTDSRIGYHDYYKLKRPIRGCVEYYDIEGKRHVVSADKKHIRIFCHEIDHMDGVTINQIGKFYVSEKV